jgi:hypothetical protein
MLSAPNLCAPGIVLVAVKQMWEAKEVHMKSTLLLVAAAGLVLSAVGASAEESRKLTPQENVALVVSQARFEFERSHAELGYVGSTEPTEQKALSIAPSAPRVGLITGMLLPKPVARIASAPSVETLLPAQAR